MEFNLSSFIALFTLLASVFMPKLIAYVAVSEKRWVNFVISYGSSVFLGVVATLADGKFGNDFFMNVTAAIIGTQAAYNLYWKPKAQEPEMPVEPPTIPPSGSPA